MPVCDVIIVSTISRTLCAVVTVAIATIIPNVRWHVGVASERGRIFARDQSVHFRTQQRGSAEKSGLRGGEKSKR